MVLPREARDTGGVTTTDIAPTTPPAFEQAVLPHAAAALRLARAVMRNDADAEDAVQDAMVRALRYFRTFDGRNGRAWFLCIVRNTCFAARRRRPRVEGECFDEDSHSDLSGTDQEARLVRRDRAEAVARAVVTLPPMFRELFVLREVEGLSYRELARRIDAPIGTVMSRLSRARQAARPAVAAPIAPRRSFPPIGFARVRDSRGATAEARSRQRRAHAS